MKPITRTPRLIACGMLSSSAILPAADYYVSSSLPEASDTNPGTGSQPWKTIARVNAAALAAGDTVHFRCGDLWREKLVPPKSGTATRPITFTSYGTGAKPVISGAEIVTAPWTADPAGTPGTYRVPMPVQVKMVTRDGAYVKWNKTFTSLAANQYGWDNGTLYLNLGGADPSSSLIEAGRRDHGISGAIDRDHVTIRGLRVEKSNNSLIRLDRSEFWRIEECEIHYGNSDSSTAGGGISGDRMHDVVIRANHINYSLGDGVIAWRSARVTIDGNRIENIYDEGGASGSDCIQVGAKSSTPNACDGFRITNNVVSRHATDTQKGCIIQEMGDNGILAGNTCIKGMFGLSSSGNNNIVEHNYVTGYGVGGGIRISQDTDMYGMKIRYNVITQSPGFAGITLINDKRGASPKKRSNFEIHNNVVYNTYYGIGSDQPFSGTIRNNIVWSPSANPRMRISTGTPIEGEGVTVSHNILKDATTETMAAIAGQRFYDMPSLQAAGWGAGSSISDPMFQNVAAADFHLKAGSPAIDTGHDMGLIRDYDGTPVPAGPRPDIGAFEYSAAGTSRLIIGGEGVPLLCALPVADSFSYATADLPAWASASHDAGTRLLTISGIPAASGPFTGKLKRADGSEALEIRFHIFTDFTAWQRRNYSPAELGRPEISGPTAAPGGVPNLVKYAMGRPAEEGVRPSASVEHGSLSLTYTRDRFADVQPVVEVSSDLLTWRSGGAFTEDVSRMRHEDGTETITTRDLVVIGSGPRFMRLRAE